MKQAIVVAAGTPGLGGLGAAGEQAMFGLRECGFGVDYVGLDVDTQGVRRLIAARPFRRSGRLRRWADRRDVRARIPAEWDLAYVMPGYLPRARPGRVVLHQATHAPNVVLEQLDQARRQAGGGSVFMSAREARMLATEIASADLVRTESRVVYDELLEFGVPEERLVCAPPGVRLDRFAPGERDERFPTVAFVGTLSLWKGVDVLLPLATAIRSAGGVLRVIGGPVDSWSRRLAARLDFERAGADVPALLATSHALVLPSASDGFGYVVLEAMASGCVPFVTPEVGAAEVVREVDPQLVVSRDEFAARVSELLKTLPLAELGDRLRAAATDYDWETRSRAAAEAIVSRLEVMTT